jgi:hypothetical protein
MSEEEKKAVEDLKRLKKGIEILNQITVTKDEVDIIAIDTILDLIEKQQKEIEELKQNRDEYKQEYIKLQNARYYNYISKDIIREIISEYRKQLESADTERTAIMLSNFIMVLKDLLEEK